MRLASRLCQVVIIIYLGYRVFTTFAILPFVASPLSSSSLYFVAMLSLAIGITVISFLRRDALATVLAIVLCLAAFAYWWVAICRMSSPIWADFGWFVAPEIGFGIAILIRYMLTKHQGFLAEPSRPTTGI